MFQRLTTNLSKAIFSPRGAIATLGAFLSARLGVLAPFLLILTFLMVVDWGTGLTASNKEGTVESKKGLLGIIKKLSYLVAIAVAISIDWVILEACASMNISLPVTTFFGLLITIWFIFNEFVSITENFKRMGTALPGWWEKLAKGLKVVVEDAGDKIVDGVLDSIGEEKDNEENKNEGEEL